MSRARVFLPALAGLVLAALAACNGPRRAADATAPDGPRLAVLVVFDQMRGDYIGRWQSLFGEDGFNRLTKEGAWFQNCHYPYSLTLTAAGHATMSTTPARALLI